MKQYLNKNILIVENFFPLQTRSLRIENSLLNSGFKVHSVMWNRNGVIVKEHKNHIVFTKISRNKLRKLLSIYSYYCFIKKLLVKNHYDVIIASHWDMLFLCSCLKQGNQKLIYDNLDMPTHSNYFIRFIFRLIENISLIKTDGIIFASRFFKDFYSKKIHSITLENRPLKKIMCGFDNRNIVTNNTLNLSFFGTLRYKASLMLLMDVIGNLDSFTLTIRGSGFAEDLISHKNKNNFSNILLNTEWYNYEDLGKLFTSADLIWAAYPSKDFNVKNAISNKFFESLVFNKPAIFAKDTKLGDLVEKYNLGFTVNPYDYQSISNLLIKLNEDKTLIHSIKKSQQQFKNADNFWEDYEKDLMQFIQKI
ncbi:glycosyltransferase family protein [Sediminicola luteus]|uniref:Glycosyl transferase family 1 domain-containing protein n=1 Tax=Sediminicola luteus TaxID=319238 RepID=A0ABV2TU43_9FLAO